MANFPSAKDYRDKFFLATDCVACIVTPTLVIAYLRELRKKQGGAESGLSKRA
jgi:hypothetical protein